jgi:hypothetical protein
MSGNIISRLLVSGSLAFLRLSMPVGFEVNLPHF